MGKDRTLKFRKLYRLFKDSNDNGSSLNRNMIMSEIRWSKQTFNTYKNKKWKGLISGTNDDFHIVGLDIYTEESFVNMMSQNQSKSSDPYKDVYPVEVENLLAKAKDSAYLAIDVYNRPQTIFRSNGFIVMIIISWTALIQAFCLYNDISFYEYDKTGKPIFKNGTNKSVSFLSLLKLANFLSNEEIENLKFLNYIRDIIEHRGDPLYDIEIMGEIQANLLNFEKHITNLFGKQYSLDAGLAFPLFLLTNNNDSIIKMKKEKESAHYLEFKNYIDNYKNNLSDLILQNEKYAFKVYLIPKNANNKNTADLALEFLPKEIFKNEELKQLTEKIVLYKNKYVSVSNIDMYYPKQVAKIISETLDIYFTVPMHTSAWQTYNVRPPEKDKGIIPSNSKYCVYDKLNNKYSYTIEWIDFLAEEIKNGKFMPDLTQ